MADKTRNRKRIVLFSIVILVIFFPIYLAINYYVGLRFFQSMQGLIAPYSLFFWSSYSLCAISLFAARFCKRLFPDYINGRVAITGDYWLASVYYSFLIWIFIDILHFLLNLIYPNIRAISYPPFYLGVGVLFLICILLLYGTWNALRPRVVHYDVSIKKTLSDLSKLHAIMVSDIHLGLVVNNDRLEQMVSRINDLDPDIVFLVGDTIDEDVDLFINQKMPDIIKKLKSKYGVYAVLGNHEYISRNSELAVESLKLADVNVLVDEHVKVADQFYVVGRDDRMAGNISGKPRMELSRLIDGIDHNLPIILLDHQPNNLEEGQLHGIDLQLSGHTHNGQFFPNNLISKHVFEHSWGYLRKGDYQVVVSSGFGTWGPPIRIGSNPEIIDLTIYFEK